MQETTQQTNRPRRSSFAQALGGFGTLAVVFWVVAMLSAIGWWSLSPYRYACSDVIVNTVTPQQCARAMDLEHGCELCFVVGLTLAVGCARKFWIDRYAE